MRPPALLSVLFQNCGEARVGFVLPGWLHNFQERRQSKDSTESSQSLLVGEEATPPFPPTRQGLMFSLLSFFQRSVLLLSPPHGESKTAGLPSCFSLGSSPTGMF